MKDVKKRFPADTRMEALTFLNDKKIDGELYALLQVHSYPEEIDGEIKTVVRKKNLPTKKNMCANLGIGSPKTFNNHLNYLIERGFIEQLGEDYILTNCEDMYLMVPCETARYLKDTVQELVIKVFVYLGQRWNYKKMYVFTVEEIANHIGIKLEGNSRGYSKINNVLDLLSRLGLISYVEFYEDSKPRKRLINFSLYIPKVSE